MGAVCCNDADTAQLEADLAKARTKKKSDELLSHMESRKTVKVKKEIRGVRKDKKDSDLLGQEQRGGLTDDLDVAVM